MSDPTGGAGGAGGATGSNGADGAEAAGGGDLEGELSRMLIKQEQTQATIMKFNMESNLANAEHSNKKSMSDKIGNS